MSKILTYPFIFKRILIFIFLILILNSGKVAHADSYPECTNDTKGSQVGVFVDKAEDCPGGTYCYTQNLDFVNTQIGCFAKKGALCNGTGVKIGPITVNTESSQGFTSKKIAFSVAVSKPDSDAPEGNLNFESNCQARNKTCTLAPVCIDGSKIITKDDKQIKISLYNNSISGYSHGLGIYKDGASVAGNISSPQTSNFSLNEKEEYSATTEVGEDLGEIMYNWTPASIKPPDVEGTALIIVTTPGAPNIPNGKPIDFSVVGKGFGSFLFFVVPQGGVFHGGITPNVIFTISENKCQIDNRHSFYRTPEPICQILDKDQKTWQIDIRRSDLTGGGSGLLLEGEYEARITPYSKQGFIGITKFIIGSVAPTTLTVTITPNGPFNNNVENKITLKWSPVKKGQKFYFRTNLPSTVALLGSFECQTEPECEREITIPIAVPGPDATFTVIDAANSSITGSATAKINVVITPNVTQSSLSQCRINGSCASGAGIVCRITDGITLNALQGTPSDPKETYYVVPNTNPAQKVDPKEVGILTAIGCVPTQPKDLVNGFIRFSALGSGGIAMVLMLIAVLKWLTALGNPENLNAARDQFFSALIGLLFILFSVLLLQVIGVDILGLPGFKA